MASSGTPPAGMSANRLDLKRRTTALRSHSPESSSHRPGLPLIPSISATWPVPVTRLKTPGGKSAASNASARM